jgi:hypothetical protein
MPTYVGEILSVPWYRDNRYGVEIEVEGWMHQDNPEYIGDPRGAGFVVTTDGSLRNEGAELVCNRACTRGELRGLQTMVQSFLSECDVSHRCSVHVHVNATHLDTQQLMSFILNYALLESYLYSVSNSKGRYENIYCPGLSDSSTCSILHDLVRDLHSGYLDDFLTRCRTYPKYTGINFSRFHDIGTVEIRIHGGTTNYGAILRWVGTLDKLLNYSKEHPVTSTPLSYVSQVLTKNPADFVYEVMGSSTGEDSTARRALSHYWWNGIANAIEIART